MSARTPRLGDALVINLGTTLLFHSRALAPTTRRLSRRVSRFARQFRPRPASSMRAGETSTLSRARRSHARYGSRPSRASPSRASREAPTRARIARHPSQHHRHRPRPRPSSTPGCAPISTSRTPRARSTSSRTKVPRTTDAVRSRRPARVRATGRCSRVARAAGAVRTPSPEARTGAISRAARTREEASRRTGRFRECGTPDRRTMGVVRTRMGKI